MARLAGGRRAKERLDSCHTVDAFVIATVVRLGGGIVATADPDDLRSLARTTPAFCRISELTPSDSRTTTASPWLPAIYIAGPWAPVSAAHRSVADLGCGGSGADPWPVITVPHAKGPGEMLGSGDASAPMVETRCDAARSAIRYPIKRIGTI
jgi:hypothetical protein